jgi:hypothetical protein
MRALAIGLVMVLAAAAVPMAHHGLAQFDQTKRVTLVGTVTDFHFVSPHVVVEVDVKDDEGHTQHWNAEMTAAPNLTGWTATSLEPGNTVTVTGCRAKNGSFYIWVTQLTSSNGTRLRGA